MFFLRWGVMLFALLLSLIPSDAPADAQTSTAYTIENCAIGGVPVTAGSLFSTSTATPTSTLECQVSGLPTDQAVNFDVLLTIFDPVDDINEFWVTVPFQVETGAAQPFPVSVIIPQAFIAAGKYSARIAMTDISGAELGSYQFNMFSAGENAKVRSIKTITLSATRGETVSFFVQPEVFNDASYIVRGAVATNEIACAEPAEVAHDAKGVRLDFTLARDCPEMTLETSVVAVESQRVYDWKSRLVSSLSAVTEVSGQPSLQKQFFFAFVLIAIFVAIGALIYWMIRKIKDRGGHVASWMLLIGAGILWGLASPSSAQAQSCSWVWDYSGGSATGCTTTTNNCGPKPLGTTSGCTSTADQGKLASSPCGCDGDGTFLRDYFVCQCIAPSCDLGCGGSVVWRTSATQAWNDMTCPSGSKLLTTGGNWTGAACNSSFTRDPGGTIRCQSSTSCNAPPTAWINASGPVAVAPPVPWWRKALSYIVGDKIALAGTSTTITAGQNGRIDWGSTNATSCSITGSGSASGYSASGTSGGQRFASMSAGTYTYTINCTGAGGSDSDSARITVTAPATPVNGACGSANGVARTTAPTTGLCSVGTPSAVTGGGPWSWTCIGSNVGSTASCSAPVAPTNVNGNCASTHYSCLAGVSTNQQTLSDRWTWTCQGSGIGTSDSCSEWRPPAITLSANPSTIALGDTSTLTWSVTNASSCSLNQGIGSVNPVSGNRIVSPSVTTTYTMSCSGPGGSANRSRTVTVTTGTPPPTPDLMINGSDGPLAVSGGDNLNLTWPSVANATSCTGSGANWSGIKAVAGGNDNISASISDTYRLTCTGPGGSGSDDVVVTIGSGPDYRLCPTSTAVNVGGTTQVRAYYLASGTINCTNTSGATEVTGSVNWSSANAGIASVNNTGSKGLVTGISTGNTTIAASSYLGLNASPVTVAVIGCIPKTCSDSSFSAELGNTCPDDTKSYSDSCGGTITCSGTRNCNFNWREIAP